MRLEDIDNAQSLVGLFLHRAGEQGDKPFLTAKHADGWQSISYSQAERMVCLMAASLRRLGLTDGDRVMIVSENRPEWCIADLAIMAAGCITTPAYTTNTESDHRHILDDSGAKAVFVSDAKLAKALLPAIIKAGETRQVIAMEELPSAHQSGAIEMHGWQALLQGDYATARADVEARVARTTRDDLACIIYTSGTSGAPRGVMLHNGAVLRNMAVAAEVLSADFGWGDDRFLSFLPLSHALEHTAGLFLPVALGADIWFAEGLDKLSSNLVEARPTFMIVVPRLFEILREKIIKQVEKQGGAAAFLLEKAIALGERQLSGERRLRDRPLEWLLDVTLRPKIKERFGGRIKALVSGGAPLNPEVGGFFQAMGLVMLQGYGQTETAPVVSCNYPSAGIRLHTVGPPLTGVEVRIADDGEILVRGEQVMKGYWRNPADTAKAIVPDPAEPEKGGWLHTGDIGHFDPGGRIVITDRKKDIVVNDKGDNIAPQKLEGMLTLQPEIAQAMVAGDRRPHMVALLVPDADWVAEWSRANLGSKLDLAEVRDEPAFRAALKAAVDRTNADLSVIEKVRKFALADEAFTTANSEMTPTMKIRRHQIRARYGERLDALYKN